MRKFQSPPLAQLVRAQSLYLWGPWFESMKADFEIVPNEWFQIQILVRALKTSEQTGGPWRRERRVEGDTNP